MKELTPNDHLTQDELRRLLKVPRLRRDRAILLVAYRHGLRASEVGLVRTSHVDLKRRRIFCRRLKGSWSQEQLLGDDEVKLLRPLMVVATAAGPDAPVFISKKGNPISRKRLDAMMKTYGRAAEIPESKRHFHVLKHSLGVHVQEGGADLALTQDLLGHKSIKNTRVYAQYSSPRRDQLHRLLLDRNSIV